MKSVVADVTFSTEASVAVGSLLASLALAIGFVFRLLVASYDKQIVTLTADRDSWRQMSDEAISNLEKAVTKERVRTGKPPFKTVAPVVPEHSSPVTDAQQRTADMQTSRARLVFATMDLDLEPRTAT